MSIIKDLQRIATARIHGTDKGDPNSTTEILENAAVDVVEHAIGTSLAGALGSSSIVKIFTAVQQLVLTLEEVKQDVQKNNPELWAEIVSAFPSLERTVSTTNS